MLEFRDYEFRGLGILEFRDSKLGEILEGFSVNHDYHVIPNSAFGVVKVSGGQCALCVREYIFLSEYMEP